MTIRGIVSEVLQTQVLTQEQHQRIGLLMRSFRYGDADLQALEHLIKALVNKSVKADSRTLQQLLFST